MKKTWSTFFLLSALPAIILIGGGALIGIGYAAIGGLIFLIYSLILNSFVLKNEND